MHPDVTRLRKEFDSSKKVIKASVTCCDRCGMTQKQLDRYPRQLELHHIKSIASYVKEGVTDPKIVNSRENISCLCTFCHTYWHKVAEVMGASFKEFMEQPPAHIPFLR